MLRRNILNICAVAVLLIGIPSILSAQLTPYWVVVNQANPVSSMSKDELSRIFLKRTVRWENGELVVAVDLPEDSETRIAFTEAIHGRSVRRVKAYWQQQIFSGRAVPPTELSSDEQVLAFVSSNETAIGYVSGEAFIGGNVKVLRISEGQ
ncbi:MAG: hypothetical protein QNJ97_27560 [Myxococcota bacterium]|nr:hypothetical protein [Myxococcota bacterium]